MSRKALKVVVELKFRAVSCPGVHLPAKDDIYLSVCFMGQYRQSECLPAVFPLLFHEKMTFEKIFRHTVDPGDIAIMLEYETVTIELVQLNPRVADTLAYFEDDVRHFLFPEPKLVPCSSGVDREVLMTRVPHFPGIAPRLEFSTKTTIIECSAYAETNIYPNVPMRPKIKRNRKQSSRPRSSSPQRKQPQTSGRRRGGSADTERPSSDRWPSYVPRAQSLSPLRAGNTQRLSRPSLASAAPSPANWDTTSTYQPVTKLDYMRYSPTGSRKSLHNGLVGGIPRVDSGSSETFDPVDFQRGPEALGLSRSYRELARHSSLLSSSHIEWEDVQERVRGLLTTPKAVRRLAYGATHSEVDEVLARRSISPGPPW
ncbi:spermatogenesis associated 6-like protein [Centropristis striata]|uniref:spermatogenesis associated 6-like protein n=1 Tax=Centropristis striata TaxID=184440 RepID=UPI0027DF2988|nr:spermatogenesis associated 6-like protein [Centropristis striata]